MVVPSIKKIPILK